MKVEYPPLLAAGFHPMTLSRLEEMCVKSFDTSLTRADIFKGLKTVVETLESAGISGELWIDGSFLTQKPDPKDSDIVLCISGEAYDLAEGSKRDIIDWVRDGLPRRDHRCDSYVLFLYRKDHELYNISEWMRAYWIKQFGWSRNEEMKGMALINI